MNAIYTPVRLSHLLRHCSVGAIVRVPDGLLTVMDTRHWTDRGGEPAGRLIPYVDQVRAALDIPQQLREPPIARQSPNGLEGVCVPTLRFPRWARCPACGLLYYQPWRQLDAEQQARCQCSKQAQLEQVSWVLVHPDGHLADLPWHWLAHRDAQGESQRQCRRDWQAAYLVLRRQGTAWRLSCQRCQAHYRPAVGMSLSFANQWRQPWLREPPPTQEDEDPAPAEIVEINDVRIHSPLTRTALVIPPESRVRRGTVVDRLYSSSERRRRIATARTPLQRQQAIRQAARDFRCASEEIEEALGELERGYPLYGKHFTQGLLLEGEYQALLEKIPDLADDEDFVTRHQGDGWQALAPTSPQPRAVVAAVEHLVEVTRLKEVQVCVGFQRLAGEPVAPDIVGESGWLPALELYGEGIFFSLAEEPLARWEADPAVQARAASLRARFVMSGWRFEPQVVVTPRFLLLHTLAHLLIRRLEAEAGYPAASLKERLYCANGQRPMAGILVYVAVADVVGSLGGLAELAEPRRFLSLLNGVFEQASWCSLDPVCGEHPGQGPGLLNRAACHACALVPEPACAYGNSLLDRGFIKGDPGTGLPAFLAFVSGV